MAKPDWPPDARDPGPFDERLKCCTYDPFIPNFSIGRIWAELDLSNLLPKLTPLGLIPTASASSLNFGRDPNNTCGFLSQGRCTVWSHRPSVCRSYFCVSDEGSEGQVLWREAERLGNQAEWDLAHEVLWEMGFTQDDRGFAEWRGREREFFLECAQRAAKI